MTGKADLHCHTYYSDGELSPTALVQQANESALSILSITDHDSIDAYWEALEAARQYGIELVPGVELSAMIGTKDIHILGYFFNPDNEQLKQALNLFRQERLWRAERMVRKLNNLNVPLSMEAVLSHAGHGAIGRPHIAAALVDEGHTSTYSEAFDTYIGNTCPAYEPKYRLSPETAVEIIAGAGGISIIAHPGWYLTEDEIMALIRAGVDGIETVHPAHDAERITFYRNITSSYFLLEGGGSDFHGGKRNDQSNFGAYTVPSEIVQAMKRRLFIQ